MWLDRLNRRNEPEKISTSKKAEALSTPFSRKFDLARFFDLLKWTYIWPDFVLRFCLMRYIKDLSLTLYWFRQHTVHTSLLFKTFPDNLLTLMSTKTFMSFLKHSRVFLYILDLNAGQQVEGPNYSFSAASKGFTQSLLRNKDLI